MGGARETSVVRHILIRVLSLSLSLFRTVHLSQYLTTGVRPGPVRANVKNDRSHPVNFTFGTYRGSHQSCPAVRSPHARSGPVRCRDMASAGPETTEPLRVLLVYTRKEGMVKAAAEPRHV